MFEKNDYVAEAILYLQIVMGMLEKIFIILKILFIMLL